MAEYKYNISASTYFTHERDAYNSHLLFVHATYISPVTNKETVTKRQIYGMPESDAALFYRHTEHIMTNEQSLKREIAEGMAQDLKEQLKETGVDFDNIEKAKFEERLKLQYQYDVYVDLELASQTGVQ